MAGTLTEQQNDIYEDCTYQFSQGAAFSLLSSAMAKFSAQSPQSYEGIPYCDHAILALNIYNVIFLCIATGDLHAPPVQPNPLQSNPFQDGATFLQSQGVGVLSPPTIANLENQESHEGKSLCVAR